MIKERAWWAVQGEEEVREEQREVDPPSQSKWEPWD